MKKALPNYSGKAFFMEKQLNMRLVFEKILF